METEARDEIRCMFSAKMYLKRQLREADEREAQGCAIMVRLYVASLKQEWEPGETLDEVTGDIRHHLANCGREEDLERALTGEGE